VEIRQAYFGQNGVKKSEMILLSRIINEVFFEVVFCMVCLTFPAVAVYSSQYDDKFRDRVL